MSRSALIACAAVALVLFAGGLLGFASLVLGSTETKERSFAAGREVRIESGSGDISVSSGPAGSRIELVTREHRGPFAAPHVWGELAGGTLRLGSSCSGVSIGACSVEYDVRVPTGTTLRVRTGSGDIHGVTGARVVDADTGSGDIELRATGVRRLRLHTGSGDVTARVGAGPYAVRTQTGSGDKDVTVKTDPRAPLSIDARTGSGDVRIAPVS